MDLFFLNACSRNVHFHPKFIGLLADKVSMLSVGRCWLLKAPLLFGLFIITACSSSEPQVDFLKSLINGSENTGIRLTINGAQNSWSQNPTPLVEISGFSNASKIEIFTSSTCDNATKAGEVAATSTDTLRTISATSLPLEGAYDYYAKVTSDKGLVGECSTQKATYHYDITPPAVPSKITLSTTSHSSATPIFQVDGIEVGDSVLLYKDAACAVEMGSAVATSSSVSVTSTSLIEGNYNYYAKSRDAAGNISACSTASATYIYDITPPTAPSTVALSTGVVSPDSSFTPTVDVGGLIAGDTVKIYSDLLCLTEVGSALSTATSMMVTTTLTADGSFSFHAKALDPYGNASTCSSVSAAYVLDSTPPAVPTSLTLSYPASSPSNVSTPQIQISPVTDGDTVHLFSDSSCTILVASGIAASSSVILTASTLSSSGSYNFYAQAVDPIGNISACSTASFSYQFDNLAPSVSSVTSSNADKTYGPGAEIQIQVNLNESVSVSTNGGTPTLTLNTNPTRMASYSSGSGSNVLTFTYVVQPGDTSSDLNYSSASALSLNSGSIKDLAGNDLNFALPSTNSTQSLGTMKNIVITDAPPLVKMVGPPTITLNEGAGSATVQLILGYETFYPITVHVMTSGNALYGSDYTLSSDTIVFAAGSTTASFTVNVFENALNDSPRKIKLSIDVARGNHGALINRISQKDIYLIDNDTTLPAPSLLARGGTGTHSCVIKADNSIQCWGSNTSGQLGDNTQVDRLIPTLISGSTTSFIQSAAGGAHTCAIQNDKTLWCWGYGGKGALGNGSITSTKVPTQVGTLTTYHQVAAGAAHTCAIRYADDTLWCFGDNAKKQLGGGSTNTQENSPIQADTPTTYAMVATGETHTCGITLAGDLKCWGNNVYGQIGVGTYSSETDPPTTPTIIDSGTPYSKVATGAYHTCAITTGETMKCWGDNSYGQLGNGTTTPSSSPVSVTSLSGVVDVVAGTFHTCVLLNNDDVKCWGDNTYGQLGQLLDVNSSSPISVFTSDVYSTDILSLSAGSYHNCAVFSQTGEMRCWGNNSVGQLGTGTDYRVRVPALVEKNMVTVASGINHSCGITSSGAIRCWGTNSYGQLGDGTTYSRSAPVEVIASGAVKIAVGEYFSCAVMTDGKLLCWGYNGYSRLGDGTTTSRLRPTAVISSGVADISLGVDHGCALLTSGEVRCWGNNTTSGKVGNNSTSIQSTPVSVIASGASQVSVSETHSCARVGTDLYCWGDNTSGQFGNGTNLNSKVPTWVLSNIQHIASGNSYSCGILSGYLNCWGLNSSYQLGTGNTINSSTPVIVDGTNTYSQVSANYTHTCAITTTDQKLKCWGQNNKYQIANSGSGLTTPTTITTEAVLQNSVGYYHTCFITTANDLKCMGTNGSGQLGLGDLSLLRLPLHVFGL